MSPDTTLSTPLGPILTHLRGEPSRTWSIVITVFGDAVVPRGGSLWLGTLLLLFETMGIGGGVVRTAMSRLTADGWLDRGRAGRNSFYTLTAKGQASFADAARRIYGPPPDANPGRLDIVLPGGVDLHDAMRRAGFGFIDGVWVAPAGTAMPAEAAGALHVHGCMDEPAARRLAALAWPLDRHAEAYLQFNRAFAPLHQWLSSGGYLSGLDAITARTLLIHEYRRLVLRDPRLPRAWLPPDWPGFAARYVCAGVYRAVLPESERWLDEHGRDEAGALPPPAIDLAARFSYVTSFP